MESIEILISESPVSDNHGRRASDRLPIEHDEMDGQIWPSSYHDLDGQYAEAMDAIGGNCSIVTGKDAQSGMVAHRGVLTEDEFEWLDWDAILGRVVEFLGCTIQEVQDLYSQGVTDAGRERRIEVDARLLQLQEAGSNMHLLAASLGWRVADGHSRKMERALARARKARHEDR